MTNTEKKTLLAEFEKFLNIQTEELTVRRSTTVQTDEYEVGDIIDFTLKTGEEVSAMAMRKETDGILFVFVDCLKTEYPMNSSLRVAVYSLRKPTLRRKTSIMPTSCGRNPRAHLFSPLVNSTLKWSVTPNGLNGNRL